MNTAKEIIDLIDVYTEEKRIEHVYASRDLSPVLRNDLLKVVEVIVENVERYLWLRDRMQVRYESPMSGGDKRATLAMRVGHGFLDSKKPPESGWLYPQYFDECRENVDSAIDAAMNVKMGC